jgi:uncharacterized membrane protein YvlD (DUF360 family)
VVALTIPLGFGLGVTAATERHYSGNYGVWEREMEIIWICCFIIVLLVQPFILRFVIRYSCWWFFATLVGGGLGLYIATNLHIDMPRFMRSVMSVIGWSFGVTFFQWLILRQSFRQAYLWFPLSMLAWILTFYIPRAFIDRPIHATAPVVFGLFTGGIYACVSGGSLFWLFSTRKRHPIQEAQSSRIEDFFFVIQGVFLFLVVNWLLTTTYSAISSF